MMNLGENVKIAKIAKVREKISDGVNEYDDLEAAEQEMEKEKANMPVETADDLEEDDEDMIFPKEEEDED